jgi:hypothetical protein
MHEILKDIAVAAAGVIVLAIIILAVISLGGRGPDYHE